MNIPIKLIVFDCDGVMFDSRPANKEYYNYLLKYFQKPEMDENELEYVHIQSVDRCLQHIFRNHHDIARREIEKLRESLDYKTFLKYFVMEQDLIAFLTMAKERNIYLAISTNRADTMQLLLDEFALTPYFQKVMTSATATRPKPAPDGMLEILDFFGVRKEETVFIGDSMVDYHHAANSGVRLISFKNKELPTPFHIKTFMEIWSLPLTFLDKKNALN